MATVRVAERFLRTSASPGFAERALARFPGLARHSCDNDRGARFVDELADTETAHAFEHLACEIMARAGSPRSLRGVTSWDFRRDGRGVFKVTLEFDDDVRALAALKEAAGVLGELLGE